jgi:hybrid cluster-associated redox disulfide protein
MQKSKLTFDLTVDEVMRRWPSTIRVFLDFRLGCVGCPIAPFHSLADACREHRLDAPSFFDALRAIVDDREPQTLSVAR